MRIVSLIASATEIICALGFENQMVGRSHECDFPEGITRLPACSSPKIDVSVSALEIDRQVKRVVQESLSVYRVDTEKLKMLKPDIIITQDHCEVCAVNLKDVKQAVCDWLENTPKIVSLRPNNLADIWIDIKNVAQALGVPKRGDDLIRAIQTKMEKISTAAKNINKKYSVGCIEWFDPLMAAGNWVPELVGMLGVVDLFGIPGEHAPCLTWDSLVDRNPDFILTMPCGWGLSRSQKELSCLTSDSRWNQLKAVKNNRAYLTDGNQYFNRPGPRLLESMEIMAEIIYPKVFNFGHHGAFKKL